MDRDRSGRIIAHLELVRGIALSLQGRGISTSDLVQEGCLALVREIDRFDARHATLTTSRIKARARMGMLRAIRKKRAASANHLRLTPAREAQANVLDPFTALWSAQLDARVALLLARLSDLDRAVLEFRFGLGGDRRRTSRQASGILKLNPKSLEHRELGAIARLRRSARKLLPLLRST